MVGFDQGRWRGFKPRISILDFRHLGRHRYSAEVVGRRSQLDRCRHLYGKRNDRLGHKVFKWRNEENTEAVSRNGSEEHDQADFRLFGR